MRTFAFQKTSETIITDQFLTGVWTKNNKEGGEPVCVTAGLQCSRSQLFYHMKVLRDKKIVICTPNMSAKGKNTGLVKYTLNMAIERTNLRVRPKPQSGKPDYPRPENRTTPVRKTGHIKEYIEKSNEKVRSKELTAIQDSKVIQLRNFMEPKNTIADICKSKASAIADRNAGKRTAKGNREDMTGWYKTWNNAMLEYYPKVPVVSWTQQTCSMFKKFLNRGLIQRGAAGKTFLTDSIANWDFITRTYFKRMEDIPAIPSLRFFIKFYPTFIEAVYYINEGRGAGALAKPQPTPAAVTLQSLQNKAHLRELAARDAAHALERNELLRRLGEMPLSKIKPVFAMPCKKVVIAGEVIKDWEEHNG